ncbi:MAG: ABC transporter substrate-binding protein [Candidatus Muirbacterium halophilum]|nr:ABC transporter substrate-binding protein [Candidatus Muirbacterium halophilum]MCK9476106.1 ABC transporter substrate-binding protein [Candidatus Muirbacterium halophilum]
MRRIYLLISAIFLCFIFLGCEKADTKKTEQKNYGDFFVRAINVNPSGLTPHTDFHYGSRNISRLIIEPLFNMRNDGEIEPVLGDSHEIIIDRKGLYLSFENDGTDYYNDFQKKYNENKSSFANVKQIEKLEHWAGDNHIFAYVQYNSEISEDEKQKWFDLYEHIDLVNYPHKIKIKIKENVLWHDGKAFTSHDAKFTFSQYIGTGVRKNSQIYNVKSVDTDGRYGLTIDLYRPGMDMISLLEYNIYPFHILKDKSISDKAFGLRPVGTGPFVFQDWKQDEYIILKRNEDYYYKKPYFSRVVFKVIPDKSQQFVKLMNEELDYMEFTFDQYKNYKDIGGLNERFVVHKMPWVTTGLYVGYNNSIKPLDNINVRKALSYSINVNEIIENIYYGNAKRITGPFVWKSSYYDETIAPLEYLPEHSRQLLLEEGYIKNKKGFFEKDGKELLIRITTNSAVEEFVLVVNMIKSYWENNGIRCEIFNDNFHDSKDRIKNNGVEAFFAGWIYNAYPSMYSNFHSAMWPEKSGIHANVMRYSNETVDLLLENSRYEMNRDKLGEITREIHKILYREQPCTFMFADDIIAIIHKRIKGVFPTSYGTFNSIREWYVPEDEVKYK